MTQYECIECAYTVNIPGEVAPEGNAPLMACRDCKKITIFGKEV